MISSRSRYDLFDSPPYISTVFRALRKCKKNTQEQYEILKFDPAKTLINQGFSAEKTARANAHFECRTFDHSDNSPCISTVFRALRKCKKNRQERYEILKLELGKTLINQGFSAEKTARANAHFESVPLWPLQYRSVLQTQQSFADIITAGRAKIKPGFFSCTNLWLA